MQDSSSDFQICPSLYNRRLLRAYHHHYEYEVWDQIGDGKDTDSGADGQTHARAAHRRQKQRQEHQKELHHIQPESFTASHKQQPALRWHLRQLHDAVACYQRTVFMLAITLRIKSGNHVQTRESTTDQHYTVILLVIQ